MKKVTYTLVVAMLCTLTMISCKKRYHCACSYQNKVTYTEDLGVESENDARNKCSSYDSTVTGEVWTCNIY